MATLIISHEVEPQCDESSDNGTPHTLATPTLMIDPCPHVSVRPKSDTLDISDIPSCQAVWQQQVLPEQSNYSQYGQSFPSPYVDGDKQEMLERWQGSVQLAQPHSTVDHDPSLEINSDRSPGCGAQIPTSCCPSNTLEYHTPSLDDGQSALNSVLEASMLCDNPDGPIALPLICMADHDHIYDVLASTLYHRRTWEIPDLVVGITFEKHKTAVQIVLAWLAEDTLPDHDLVSASSTSMAVIRYMFTNHSQPFILRMQKLFQMVI